MITVTWRTARCSTSLLLPITMNLILMTSRDAVQTVPVNDQFPCTQPLFSAHESCSQYTFRIGITCDSQNLPFFYFLFWDSSGFGHDHHNRNFVFTHYPVYTKFHIFQMNKRPFVAPNLGIVENMLGFFFRIGFKATPLSFQTLLSNYLLNVK